MAEYWISQPKHHCEFCHCWIADNKPSRDYHEQGKKHKQNVQAKISSVHKKCRDDAKQKEEISGYIKEMEENALKAYKKDLENNPALAASHTLNTKAQKQEEPKPSNEVPEKQENKNDETDKDKSSKEDVNAPENWDEDTTPEGYTYYWNIVTRESRWVTPEGYVAKKDRKSLKSTEPETTKRKLVEEIDTAEEKQAESAAAIEGLIEGPELKPTGLSSWEDVAPPVEESSEEVDLQLPQSSSVVEVIKVSSGPKFKFKQKTPTFSDSLPVAFKKRKTGIGYRNLKERTDDS